MKKKRFISSLSDRISYMNVDEKNEILSYYSELIDDRIDMGENEEDVISSLGSLDIIVENISGNYYQKTSGYNQNTARGNTASTTAYYGTHNKKSNSNIGNTIFSIIEIILLIALAAIGIGTIITTIVMLIIGLFVIIGSFVFMSHDLFAGLIQLGVGIVIIAVNSIISQLADMLARFAIKKVKSLIEKIPS